MSRETFKSYGIANKTSKNQVIALSTTDVVDDSGDDDETVPLLPLGETTNTTKKAPDQQVPKSTKINTFTVAPSFSFNPNYKENTNTNINTIFSLSNTTNNIRDGEEDVDDIETALHPAANKLSNNFGSTLTQEQKNVLILYNSTSDAIVDEQYSSNETSPGFCLASFSCCRSFFGVRNIHLISPLLLLTTLLTKIWQITRDGVGENFVAFMAQFTSPVTGFFAGIYGYFSLQMSHTKTHEKIDRLDKKFEERMAVKKIRVYRVISDDGYEYKEVFIPTEQVQKGMGDIKADNGGAAVLYVAQHTANQSNNNSMNPFNFDDNPELCQQLNNESMKMFVWHLGRPVSVDQFMCLSLEEVFGGQVGGVLQLEISVRKSRGGTVAP